MLGTCSKGGTHGVTSGMTLVATLALTSISALPTLAFADTVEWDVSAFLDFQHAWTNEATEASPHDDFHVGQLEIDLSAETNRHLSAEAAVAFDQDAEAFVLGAAFVDLHREAGARLVGVTLGQFDVPFGIDRHCYASIDRPLVSTPLAVASTHGCWNDQGITAYVEGERLTLLGFATNGYSVSIGSGDESLDGDPRHAIGGRCEVRILDEMAIGASVAKVSFEGASLLETSFEGASLAETSLEASSAAGEFGETSVAVGAPELPRSLRDANLFGFDLRTTLGPVEFQVEYIRQYFRAEVTNEAATSSRRVGTGSGGYLAVSYAWSQLRFLVRRDLFDADLADSATALNPSDFETRARAASFGVEYRFLEDTPVRCEWRRGDGGLEDSVVLQIATRVG